MSRTNRRLSYRCCKTLKVHYQSERCRLRDYLEKEIDYDNWNYSEKPQYYSFEKYYFDNRGVNAIKSKTKKKGYLYYHKNRNKLWKKTKKFTSEV